MAAVANPAPVPVEITRATARLDDIRQNYTSQEIYTLVRQLLDTIPPGQLRACIQDPTPLFNNRDVYPFPNLSRNAFALLTDENIDANIDAFLGAFESPADQIQWLNDRRLAILNGLTPAQQDAFNAHFQRIFNIETRGNRNATHKKLMVTALATGILGYRELVRMFSRTNHASIATKLELGVLASLSLLLVTSSFAGLEKTEKVIRSSEDKIKRAASHAKTGAKTVYKFVCDYHKPIGFALLTLAAGALTHQIVRKISPPPTGPSPNFDAIEQPTPPATPLLGRVVSGLYNGAQNFLGKARELRQWISLPPLPSLPLEGVDAQNIQDVSIEPQALIDVPSNLESIPPAIILPQLPIDPPSNSEPVATSPVPPSSTPFRCAIIGIHFLILSPALIGIDRMQKAKRYVTEQIEQKTAAITELYTALTHNAWI